MSKFEIVVLIAGGMSMIQTVFIMYLIKLCIKRGTKINELQSLIKEIEK